MTFLLRKYDNNRVRKKIIIGIFLVSLLVSLPRLALASPRKAVLAASTDSAQISMPPTAEGPGIFLPDSPFFFLDEFKQNIRLFFAFTPEEKAKVHMTIAGERLAELRIMLAKNNASGIETDLEGIRDNSKDAVLELKNAKLSGNNVSVLATSLNAAIKDKQESLDQIDEEATGELKAEINLANTTLTGAKSEIEDSLPSDLLQNEIKDDLIREVHRDLKNASGSALEIKGDIDELHRQASEAASLSLRNRQEALQKAIQEKDNDLRHAEELRVKQIQLHQTQLQDLHGQITNDTQETLLKTDEIDKAFDQVQQAISNTSNDSGTNASGHN